MYVLTFRKREKQRRQQNIRYCEEDISLKMLNQSQRHEHMPLPSDFSPKSQRRAELTIKHFQIGVVGRARSTLNTWADAWKSKIDHSSKPTSPVLNRRALDVLNVWPRQKRSASASRTQSDSPTDPNKNFLELNNNQNLRGSSCTNLTCLNNSFDNAHDKRSSFISESRNRKSQQKSTSKHSNDKENNVHLPLSSNFKKMCMDRFSRLRSFELDDLLPHRKTKLGTLRRSYDENLNQSHDVEDIVTPTHNQQRRKSLNVSLSDDEQTRSTRRNDARKKTHGKPTELKQTVVKARLKLQKIKTSDDIVLNKSNSMTRPSILYRQSSVTPISPSAHDSSDEMQSALKQQTTYGSKSSALLPPTKPRKKLSFREPVVCGRNFENFHSKTLPKAEFYLRQYERQRPILHEENDLANLELEVQFVV